MNRWGYVRRNVFALWLGVAFVINPIIYWAWPSALGSSGVGVSLHTLGYVWNILSLAGGIFIIYGILQQDIRFEVASKCLLTPALLTEAIAVAVVFGSRATYNVVLTLSLCVACVIRLWDLVHVYRTTQRDSGSQ